MLGFIDNRIAPYKRLLINLFDDPAVVLLYHRVANLKRDTHLLSVSPNNFYEQVSFLKRNYNLIFIEEFVDIITNRKKLPRKTIVLTFDDGYADNFLEALPILESQSAQAIFYITTSKLSTDNVLWWDELENIMLNDVTVVPNSLEIEVKGRLYYFNTSTMEARNDTHLKLHPLIKYNVIEERERIMQTIRNWGNATIQNEEYRLLRFEELKVMSKSRAAVIGAHTLDHPVLSQLSANEQHVQIGQSKVILEQLTEKPIVHFSYPFGSKGDYTSSTVEICKELGFKMVSSNFYGHVHRWTDVFQLPRMLVRNWHITDFKNQLNNYFKW